MSENPSELELRRRQLKPQISTVQNWRQHAVCVRKAYKNFGSKSNPVIVLDGLNMTVPKGTIYGLLGSSGCGKTTLLNCIVGRKKLNSGDIWVLGGKPGTKGSAIPGPRMGYMPQELALYGEFTIRETFKYFGWIFGMTTKQIEKKLEFLINLLLLPNPDKILKTLSGGQQRRVSFASALLHEPEILILDEPTVGVDPLLRQNIWSHLVEITKTGNRTVIITTHYIEETRQAHLIGLMRGGYLLAESSPDNLLRQFECDVLENVFLKLSILQNMRKTRRGSIAEAIVDTIEVPSGTVNDGAVLDEEDNDDHTSTSRRASMSPEGLESPISQLPPDEEPQNEFSDYFKIISKNHMKALIWKNFLWMWRNIPMITFLMGLPVLQIVVFCLSVGHEPLGLPITVINHELEESECCQPSPGCNSTRLSCNYLHYLERTMELSFVDTEEEGKELVRRGESWAVLVFYNNFSDAFRTRLNGERDLTEWDLISSSVQVYQDNSNQNIATFIKKDLYTSFETFFQDYLTSCDINTKIGRIPLRWETPIYQVDDPKFTNFATPGIIPTIIFFMAISLTSGALLNERNSGILERSLVNGVANIELLLSLVITQFVIVLIQSALMLAVAFPVFGLTQNGNIAYVALFTILSGISGMCFGLLVASISSYERTATYVSVGSLFPLIVLGGVIWPIEGIESTLQSIALLMPLTKSTESFRSIVARGWGLSSPVVYEGLVATLIWIFIFFVLSQLLFRIKKD